MSTGVIAAIFITDLVIAYLIGNYQRSNGYTFRKSFIGALIGMIGLSLLVIKAFSE